MLKLLCILTMISSIISIAVLDTIPNGVAITLVLAVTAGSWAVGEVLVKPLEKSKSDQYGGRVWIDRKFFDNIIKHSDKRASATGRTFDGHNALSPDCICNPKFEIDLFLNVGIWHQELPNSLKKF